MQKNRFLVHIEKQLDLGPPKPQAFVDTHFFFNLDVWAFQKWVSAKKKLGQGPQKIIS